MFKSLKISTINCKIKYKNRDDLLLVLFDKDVAVAGVFTDSATRAPSVIHCQKNIVNHLARALIVNAGNANAFTGSKGRKIVSNVVKKIAETIDCDVSKIFMSSTGVIGELFDDKLIIDNIPKMVNNAQFSPIMIEKAAKSIMTTDTKMKLIFKKCKIGNSDIELFGFIKGSGMISPNMATMLGYIFTNANIDGLILQELLNQATNISFNNISVDGDRSTNDTILAFATNDINHLKINNINDDAFADFKEAFFDLAITMAKMVVIDGEGATKLIELDVVNAKNKKQAKNVAMSVINSPLIKSAIAAADPNWGRIIMAIGKADNKINPNKIKLKIGNFLITENGARIADYNEQLVHQYLKNQEVKINIDLGYNSNKYANKIAKNDNKIRVWGCDLNESYVTINKDYRS
jgi:glutamate N-acetyltransferase/amino-acid N-acetyltransferase